MYFENSRAHGTLCTLCQSSDKSDKSDLSDILCPQYRHCAMRSASRWECALFSGERHAHGAGVRHLAGRARSHVLWNFRGTGHPHSPVPIVRTSPYKSVQVRIPLPAPCALRKVPCQPTAPTSTPVYAALRRGKPCALEIPGLTGHSQSCAKSILSIQSILSIPLPAVSALRKVPCQPTDPHCALLPPSGGIAAWQLAIQREW